MRAHRYVSYAVLVSVLLLPVRSWAQAGGAIAGVVKDTTGAVLPGVTVEASSPALIEKVRTAVTNENGEYRIVDLRPGTYSVTFTLAGFGGLTREGIKLTTGFTAPVNVEMTVGALQESVTVTGASPVVDIQNTRTQNVLSEEYLTSVPIAKTALGFAAVTLGATATGAHDVGGNKGEQSNSIAYHGIPSNDMRRLLDGLPFQSVTAHGGGNVENYRVNEIAIQETVLEAGSNAEAETGGLILNSVPKDGGNRFTVLFDATYTDSRFQASNLTDDLVARGIPTPPSIKEVYDYGIGVGGPIRRDKLWFYSANRWWDAQEYIPGGYHNTLVGTLFHERDLSRPAIRSTPVKDYSIRVTWQATSKQKVTLSDGIGHSCQCGAGVGSTASAEVGRSSVAGWTHMVQGTWNYIVNNHLLVQAGSSNGYFPQSEAPQGGADFDDISVVELSTGFTYGSRADIRNYGVNNHADPYVQRAAVTYTTGTHSFKTGLQLLQGIYNRNSSVNQALQYEFRNQIPVSLIQWASPMFWKTRVRSYGLFVQDQVTLNRLTANLGVRFDEFSNYTLADDLEATKFIPARSIPRVDNLPRWRNVSPRIGVAYDLFGNAKTAIKGSFGKFLASEGTGFSEAAHPALAIVTSVRRTWTDRDGDYVPDCDLRNSGLNGECGALANSAFGTPRVATQYADDLREGWNARGYSWQTSVTLQQELAPNVALNAGYFRTSLGGQRVTQNTLVTAANFTEYCFTAPVDSRLSGGGGNRICGLYDVNPTSFGRVNNVIGRASNFGDPSQVYNGVDVGINARLGRGALLNGGVSVSRTVVDTCYANGRPDLAPQGLLASTPRTDEFCRTGQPLSAGTQIKLNGLYPLPKGFELSATLQNLPGAQITAQLLATSAMIAPTLGRNLAAGATATTLIGLIPDGTLYEDRLTQLDVRLTKVLRLGAVRVRGRLDAYNIFNVSTVLGVNPRYGSAWLRPTAIVGGRLFKVGATFDF